MAAAKILLVEDEFLIRLTLSEALSDEGFDVLQASSGDEAMTLVADPAGLSLLLTDVELPGALNGNALARSLRERAPELRVIFMTGRPDSVVNGKYDVTVAKPYLLADMCAVVRGLIAP